MTNNNKTITFEPHPDLQLIPEADRLKWADALDTSIQHKGRMCNEDDSAHCCLCVGEQVLNGATFENYKYSNLPVEMSKIPYLVGPSYGITSLDKLSAAHLCIPGCVDKETVPFASLNDYYLTHPQIAQLLRGEAVPITQEDTDE